MILESQAVKGQTDGPLGYRGSLRATHKPEVRRLRTYEQSWLYLQTHYMEIFLNIAVAFVPHPERAS